MTPASAGVRECSANTRENDVVRYLVALIRQYTVQEIFFLTIQDSKD